VALGLLLGGAALAAVGLWDDRHGLSPFVRLMAQLAVAAGVVWLVGGIDRLPLPYPLDLPLGPASRPATVLWLVGVVNFFNFLDGIDGLAAVQTVVTAAGISLAGWDPFAALLAAVVAGAAAGFLPFNWSPASVFLGDVGSYFLGYTLAALPLAAPPESRARAALFVALSLWLFLADAAWTLLKRACRGAPWYEAHREHLYQHLALRQGHPRVAATIGAGSLVLTAGALVAYRSTDPAGPWAVLALAVVLFIAECALVRSGRAA
jgi:UDP-GlcNAc:undecaprenyl-phosphate GlcNAc-1-phosphate transferase